MSIGHSLPRIRVPALTAGKVGPLDISQFREQWVTLCCLSRLGLVESYFLNRYRHDWAKQWAILVGLVIGAYPFHEPWVQQVTNLGIPLLGDPLGRVCRALKISEIPGHGRCQSLIVNPGGIVEYHLIHDLNGRGMSAISEIFQLCKNSQTPRGTQLKQTFIDGSSPAYQPFLRYPGKSGSVLTILTRHDRKMKKRPHIDVQEIKENQF
jgi:hypothetical protein